MKHLMLAEVFLIVVVPSASAQTASYSQDIAPMFAMKCNRCHGSIEYPSSKPAGGLDTTNYRSLRRGGSHGPGIKPGDTKASSVLMDLPVSKNKYEEPHPTWSREENVKLHGWISANAPFDGEPEPRDCVDINSVKTFVRYPGSRNYDNPAWVYFRAWAPGYVSIRISESSGRVIATYSKTLEWRSYRGLGTWDDFELAKQNGLPDSVDVRVCIQYSDKPAGFAVYVGEYDSRNEGSGAQVQAVDPVEAKSGERVYLTAWHTSDEGNARFEIRSLNGKVIFLESGAVSYGLSHHSWDVPRDITPGTYVASLQTTYPKETPSRLLVLFNIGR